MYLLRSDGSSSVLHSYFTSGVRVTGRSEAYPPRQKSDDEAEMDNGGRTFHELALSPRNKMQPTDSDLTTISSVFLA